MNCFYMLNLFKNILTKTSLSILIFLFDYTAASKLFVFECFQVAFFQLLFIMNLAGDFTEDSKIRKVGLAPFCFAVIFFPFFIAFRLASSIHLPWSWGSVLNEISRTQHLFSNIGFKVWAYWNG